MAIKKIICLLFGHKYRLLRKINRYIREVKCKRCKKEFGMNDDCRALIPMDSELYSLHKEILGERTTR